MQKDSFNRYTEIWNILVSYSISQAQKPLNETGTSKLNEDSKLLVTLAEKKNKGSISWDCKYEWKDKIAMTKSQNKGETAWER